MDYKTLNAHLVKIFNNVLVIEESTLRTSRFSDVTMKEMHTVEVIGSLPGATPSDISREMMVTLGTVTVSLNRLEQKGYVERTRSQQDKRVVHLSLTKKGKLLYKVHQRFHKAMVDQIIDGMTADEVAAMTKGIENLHRFLEDLK